MSAGRYSQCDDACTVDCGHCKGAGRPVTATPARGEARPRWIDREMREPWHRDLIAGSTAAHASDLTTWAERIALTYSKSGTLEITALVWALLDRIDALAAVSATCTDCEKPLASPDELESGLCLRCLNGPLPGPMTAPTPAGDGIGGLCDRLEEARKAATPGPWTCEPNFTGGWALARARIEDADGNPVFYPSGWTDADAALIVAAVNALPALIAVARERDRLRADLHALADEHRRWAVINRDLADRVDGSDVDFHIGMAQAQEASYKHLCALLADTTGGA